ncbi:MAG TPA: hypothetical protein VEG44_04925 [Candidatus Acidoferrales bacterium]|nr:hypothetical protein [Candidatus Acidoferrales bacterium]
MEGSIPFEDLVDGIKKLLNLPANVSHCATPIGHSAENPVEVDRQSFTYSF